MESAQVRHIPVLSKSLAEQVILPPDGVMVDATIGQGGHSYLFGQFLRKNAVLIGFDVDKEALRVAESRLRRLSCKVILVHSNFSRISEKLSELGIEKADFILADLGVSSVQLADEQMGLSFTADMQLDMRIDKRIKRSAADIVNNAREDELADLIYKFGEERASRRIARFIVEQRKREAITTTAQLADIVCRALSRAGKKTKRRIHPATRTFQALRIVVNDELGCLAKLLDSSPAVLGKEGKIAVISYHSLEDRLVKRSFKKNESEGIYKVLTKKPIVPTRAEIAENRRSRSAKLRIAQKL